MQWIFTSHTEWPDSCSTVSLNEKLLEWTRIKDLPIQHSEWMEKMTFTSRSEWCKVNHSLALMQHSCWIILTSLFSATAAPNVLCSLVDLLHHLLQITMLPCVATDGQAALSKAADCFKCLCQLSLVLTSHVSNVCYSIALVEAHCLCPCVACCSLHHCTSAVSAKISLEPSPLLFDFSP